MSLVYPGYVIGMSGKVSLEGLEEDRVEVLHSFVLDEAHLLIYVTFFWIKQASCVKAPFLYLLS